MFRDEAGSTARTIGEWGGGGNRRPRAYYMYMNVHVFYRGLDIVYARVRLF